MYGSHFLAFTDVLFLKCCEILFPFSINHLAKTLQYFKRIQCAQLPCFVQLTRVVLIINKMTKRCHLVSERESGINCVRACLKSFFYKSLIPTLQLYTVQNKRNASQFLEKSVKVKTRGPWWPWVTHLSIIETKLFQNLSTGLAEEVV